MEKDDLITRKDLFYWLIFSIGLIIILISNEYNKDTNIVNYVGFAGTLISIILAVVAIIYSFFQNHTYSNINNQLNNTSENLVKLVGLLNSTSIDYHKKNEEIINNYDNFSKALHQMIGEKLEITQKELFEISSKLSEMKTQSPVGTEQQKKPTFKFEKHDLEQMLKYTSIIGKFLILGIKLLEKNKLKFKRTDFFDHVFGNSSTYAYGYYVALRSFGIFSVITDENDIDEITFVNEDIKELVNESIEKMEVKSEYNYRDLIYSFIKDLKKK
ncbi:hypothetical protein AB3N58_10050 [Leptospira sp. WS60.C2]